MVSPLLKIRQSAAELLALAVSELFPGVSLVEGEASAIGFHYDFILRQPLDEMAMPIIEERMRALIKADIPFKTTEMMRKNAIAFFRHHKQDIKADLLTFNDDDLVQIVKIGDFHDLSDERRLYVPTSAKVGAFKLQSIAPATMTFPDGEELSVIRIQGTAFPEPQSLKKFLKRIEASKKRDHRTLGKEMGLFATYDDAAVGGWFWQPKGMFLRDTLLELWKNSTAAQGFQFVKTPRFIKSSFLKKMGFFDDGAQQQEAMDPIAIEGAAYIASPSLSLQHAMLFREKKHLFKEMPVRYAECAEFYNGEKAGRLWGMLLSRAYCANAEHIFCSKQQVYDEIISSLQFIHKTLMIFGFEHHWYLVPRGKRYCGTLENWEKNSGLLVKALNVSGIHYTVDEQNAAFDGPRLEARLVDALGREWKGPTLGIDLNHPERLGLRYQGADNEEHQPVMVVRSLFGPLERFVAILVEHYAGIFPLWLAPEQVRVVPVGEKNFDSATQVHATLLSNGFRTEIDYSLDPLGTKIHAAEMEKVPHIIIVGEKEEKSGLLTVRSSGHKGMNTGTSSGISLESFLEALNRELLDDRDGCV